jgi:hypothetical protein
LLPFQSQTAKQDGRFAISIRITTCHADYSGRLSILSLVRLLRLPFSLLDVLLVTIKDGKYTSIGHGNSTVLLEQLAAFSGKCKFAPVHDPKSCSCSEFVSSITTKLRQDRSKKATLVLQEYSVADIQVALIDSK